MGGVGAPGPVSYSTLHTIKRPLVHEVFAKVGSLLALDALLHLTWFGGVGNHADGVVDLNMGMAHSSMFLLPKKLVVAPAARTR